MKRRYPFPKDVMMKVNLDHQAYVRPMAQDHTGQPFERTAKLHGPGVGLKSQFQVRHVGGGHQQKEPKP
jgi:hypothetical protein